MKLRFAIWAAVSSKAQSAADKVSIPKQISLARLAAKSKDWQETCPPFVVSGESRSKYADLTVAEAHIPQLKQMLDAAERNEFDVLVCHDFTRFRALGRPIADVLADCRVQIYSLAEPIEPQPPEHYDPARAYTASIIQDAAGMSSRAELMIKTERWRSGVSGRVDHGLAPTGNRHYGYRKPLGEQYNPRAVFEPDPPAAQILIKIKDLFLSGQSLIQIQDYLNSKRIPSPRGQRWNHTTIRHMLMNPYYAGVIEWGRMKTQAKRRIGKRIATHAEPASIRHTAGLHKPLWDKSTLSAILDEFSRRGHAYRGRCVSQLTHLLRCGVCGAAMWINLSGLEPHKTKGWRCRNAFESTRKHVYINDKIILHIVAYAVADGLRRVDQLVSVETEEEERPQVEAALRDLETRRKRWMDAYEDGQLSLHDFTARDGVLKSQLAELRSQLSALDESKALQAVRKQSLRQLTDTIDNVSSFIEKGDAQEVNALLRSILDSITVYNDGKVELHWRL